MLSFKRFHESEFDATTQWGVGVTFQNGKMDWRDAVAVPVGATGQQVADMLRQLALRIENAEKAQKE